MNQALGKRAGPSVTFWGAAQSVTGSMHLVEAGDKRFLLDCGLVLGWSSYVQERNRNFPFPPSSLSAVVLSHAHIDHCGNLPNLVRPGFDGPIYCTPATRSLLGIMLADSARIQAGEAEIDKIIGRPDESSTGNTLYSSREESNALLAAMRDGCRYDQATPNSKPGFQVRFVDAGHLLGSAMIALTMDAPLGESTLTYTGDLGRPGLKFLREPAPMPAADLIICESTYGGRTHQPVDELAEKLQDVVRSTIQRGGKVLIPAFSAWEEAQVVLHYISQWMRPSAVCSSGAGLFGQSARCRHLRDSRSLSRGAWPLETPTLREDLNPVRYIRATKDSKELSLRARACILVASGGMCEAGRILNHLENN